MCSFCNGTQLTEIMNFGEVALAGAFLKPENFAKERKYPLRLWFCHDCYAVQVADHVPPEELFNSNYFYFRSEEHTSELQSLMRISYAVFCLQQKTKIHKYIIHIKNT